MEIALHQARSGETGFGEERFAPSFSNNAQAEKLEDSTQQQYIIAETSKIRLTVSHINSKASENSQTNVHKFCRIKTRLVWTIPSTSIRKHKLWLRDNSKHGY